MGLSGTENGCIVYRNPPKRTIIIMVGTGTQTCVSLISDVGVISAVCWR